MQHLQPNTTLQGGKYRIERVLGQGGFGITYLAWNTLFDVNIAIKEFFMKDENGRDGNSVTMPNTTKSELFNGQKEKFKKEAKRMFAIKNEHIIGVHDLFEENGTAYYVMDYIDGESLAARMKRTGNPMTENEVNKILPQILDALKVIHDNGIWHLDLKPANIMIDKAGNVKLIDFGASKQMNAQKGGATTSTAISYTNGYAPREQMEQNYDKFGPWTDFYALGATLYTLLSNKRPPLPTDIDDDTSEDKRVALPFPTRIGEKTRKCILWLMNTNRNSRPQNVEELYKWINKEKADDWDLYQLLEKAKSADVKSGKILPEYLYNDSNSEEKHIIFDWFKEIAEQGDKDFQYSIAVCYALGKGTAKDLKEAAQWFKKSAEQGNVDAQHELGLCYYAGDGVDKDFFEAEKWIKKAADKGNQESKEWLESIHNENGINEETIVNVIDPQGEKTILQSPPTSKLHKRADNNVQPNNIEDNITQSGSKSRSAIFGISAAIISILVIFLCYNIFERKYQKSAEITEGTAVVDTSENLDTSNVLPVENIGQTSESEQNTSDELYKQRIEQFVKKQRNVIVSYPDDKRYCVYFSKPLDGHKELYRYDAIIDRTEKINLPVEATWGYTDLWVAKNKRYLLVAAEERYTDFIRIDTETKKVKYITDCDRVKRSSNGFVVTKSECVNETTAESMADREYEYIDYYYTDEGIYTGNHSNPYK